MQIESGIRINFSVLVFPLKVSYQHLGSTLWAETWILPSMSCQNEDEAPTTSYVIHKLEKKSLGLVAKGKQK